jgi:hypothetical protein
MSWNDIPSRYVCTMTEANLAVFKAPTRHKITSSKKAASWSSQLIEKTEFKPFRAI